MAGVQLHSESALTSSKTESTEGHASHLTGTSLCLSLGPWP